jgi:hypothetical protein
VTCGNFGNLTQRSENRKVPYFQDSSENRNFELPAPRSDSQNGTALFV